MGLKHVKERHETVHEKERTSIFKWTDNLKTGNYLEAKVKKVLNQYGLYWSRLLPNR